MQYEKIILVKKNINPGSNFETCSVVAMLPTTYQGKTLTSEVLIRSAEQEAWKLLNLVDQQMNFSTLAISPQIGDVLCSRLRVMHPQHVIFARV